MDDIKTFNINTQDLLLIVENIDITEIQGISEETIQHIQALQNEKKQQETMTPPVEKSREEYLDMVSQDPWKFKETPKKFRRDKEIVLKVVSQTGWRLNLASKELKDDEDVVAAAVAQDGVALKYASPRLQNNRKIVIAAIAQDSGAFQFASQKLKNNEDIVLMALRHNLKHIKKISPEPQNDNDEGLISSVDLKDNMDNLLQVLSVEPQTLPPSPPYKTILIFASKKLKNNRDFILRAMACNGLALYDVPNFQTDKAVVLAAVTQNGGALESASNDLQKDPDVIAAAKQQLKSKSTEFS